ncbi:MAG TPA: TIGR00180 family glycosyltransferase [Burkholderiales bacterium]|nr:TIGR00180 family glycosyltransferase [Burkholderiales bacterium]
MTTRNESVTLIIPTVSHRAALYARALRHLGRSGFPGPIIVSDHSPPGQFDAIAEVTERHAELNIKVLRHTPDAHFLTRLILCAAAAETPYVHLHADDDFLVLATLERLIGEIEGADDCVAAMGINLHASLDSREIFPLVKSAIPYPRPFDRLMAQLECYSSVLYALRRRDELMSTFSFTVERCPDVQFWQYLESCVASIRGRVAVRDDLHYVRGLHGDKWSATLVRERSPDHFPYLILSAEFHPRFSAFRAALVAACEAHGVTADPAKLEGGLIHLLHRGFGAMGLPRRNTAETGSATNAAWAGLQQKLRDPATPEAIELKCIFESARVEAGPSNAGPRT